MNKNEMNKVIVERVNNMEISSKALEERNILNPSCTVNVLHFAINKGEVGKQSGSFKADLSIVPEDYTAMKAVINIEDAVFITTGVNATLVSDLSFDFCVLSCPHMGFLNKYSHVAVNINNGNKLFIGNVDGKGLVVNPNSGKKNLYSNVKEAVKTLLSKEGYIIYHFEDGTMTNGKQKKSKYLGFREHGDLNTNTIEKYCNFLNNGYNKGLRNAMKNSTRAGLAFTNSTARAEIHVAIAINDLTHFTIKDGKIAGNNKADGEMLINAQHLQEQFKFKGVLNKYIKGDADTIRRLCAMPLQVRILERLLTKVKSVTSRKQYIQEVVEYCIAHNEKIVVIVNSKNKAVKNLPIEKLLRVANVVFDLNATKQWGALEGVKDLLSDNTNPGVIDKFEIDSSLPLNVLKVGHRAEACFNEQLHRLFTYNLAVEGGRALVNKFNETLATNALNYMENELNRMILFEAKQLIMGSNYSLDLIRSIQANNPSLFNSDLSQFADKINLMINKLRIPYGDGNMEYLIAASDPALKVCDEGVIYDTEIFNYHGRVLAHYEDEIEFIQIRLKDVMDKETKAFLEDNLNDLCIEYAQYYLVHSVVAVTKMPIGDNGSLVKSKLLSYNTIKERVNALDISQSAKDELLYIFSNPYDKDNVYMDSNDYVAAMEAGRDYDIDAVLCSYFKQEDKYIIDAIKYGIIKYSYKPGIKSSKVSKEAKDMADRIFSSIAKSSNIKIEEEDKEYNIKELFMKLGNASVNIGALTNESSVISSIAVEALTGIKTKDYDPMMYCNQFLYETFEKKSSRGLIPYVGLNGEEVITESRIDEIVIEFRDCLWNFKSKMKFLADLSFVFNFYQEGGIDFSKTGDDFKKIISCLSVKIQRLRKYNVIYSDDQRINYLERKEFTSKVVKTRRCSVTGTIGNISINTIELEDYAAKLQNKIADTFNALMLGQGTIKSKLHEGIRNAMKYSNDVVDSINDILQEYADHKKHPTLATNLVYLYDLKDVYKEMVNQYANEKREINEDNDYDDDERKYYITVARESMLKKISGIVTVIRKVLNSFPLSNAEKGAILLGVSGSILRRTSSGSFIAPEFNPIASNRMPMNVAPEMVIAFLNKDIIINEKCVTSYGEIINIDDENYYNLADDEFIIVNDFIDGYAEHYILDNKYTGDGVRVYKDGHCEVDVPMSNFVNVADDLEECEIVITVLTEEIEKLLPVINSENKIKFSNVDDMGDTIQVLDHKLNKTYGKVLPESAVVINSAQDDIEYNLYSYAIVDKYNYVSPGHKDNGIKEHLILTLTK